MLRSAHLLVPALLLLSSSVGAAVRLEQADAESFVLQTGDYTVRYAPRNDSVPKDWITITRAGADSVAIGTKLAQGQHLDVTSTGEGERDIYNWQLYRKNSRIFRSLTAGDLPDRIEIRFQSERRWARFDSVLIAYKNHPGLLHWTVTAHAQADKAFAQKAPPDCHFMVNGKAHASDWNNATHDVVRYMVQRGPAAGIVYFRDLPMDSLVFYFEDFSNLNDLYRLTGADNPYDYPAEGNQGKVKLGQAKGWFQTAGDGSELLPLKPFGHEVEAYKEFGYHRPDAYRIEKGTTIVLADTYLYLRPMPEAKTDNALICRHFVEMLADVYQYIYKPPMIETDWANDIVPQLCADVLRPENMYVNGDYYYPKAYVEYKHNDQQLWTLSNLLAPLTEYVKKYPQHAAPAELKAKLDKTLWTFYDQDYQGFHNNMPPLKRDMFFHSVYIFCPALVVADLALMGNEDAVRMLEGFKPRLLDMGKKCGYTFGNVWWDDFSKMDYYYQSDQTGAYVKLMMDLYELSGNTDSACVEAAEAAAEKLADRCFDLGWQVNLTASGAPGCEQLHQVTGNQRYRDLMYIPLANALQQAWLWECDYGIGEKTTTFWALCGCPAAPSSAEYEAHQARLRFKELGALIGDTLGPQIATMVNDAWRRGPTQSLFSLPPILKKVGALPYIAAEGKEETNCGAIRYNQMIPLEDVNAGWGTDLEWWHNNSKPGVVGQEIYGAGGPIWYAVWQDELK